MASEKSRNMFNLSKSLPDLQDKTSVQHRVLCDWLRNISNQNIQIARKLTALQKEVAAILENEGSAEEGLNDIPDTESIR